MKKTPLKKTYSKIKSSNKPIKRHRKSTLKKKEVQKEKRDKYFEYHIPNCSYSEESYVQITSPSRVNICHILDKSRHPSLEDVLSNCIYLTFKEHERFDQLLLSHRFEDLELEFKNSWENTCDKAEMLLSLCIESTVLTRAFKKYLDGRIKS